MRIMIDRWGEEREKKEGWGCYERNNIHQQAFAQEHFLRKMKNSVFFFFPRCQQHPKAGKNRLEEEEEKHEATKAEKLLGMQ